MGNTTPNVNFTNIERISDNEKNETIPPPKLNNYSYAEGSNKMLSDVLGTEIIIEKCIKALEKDDSLA